MTLRPTFPLDGSAGYGFEWLRASLELNLREGVIGAGDFKVTAAAAGGMRVDVASGLAVVKGDTGTSGLGLTQGLYLQPNDASIANAVTVTASHATLPRVDQIVLTVNDSSDLGSSGDTPTLGVVTGTATTGTQVATPTAANYRAGAGALPSNAIRIADILIPAASSAVTAGNIVDRRPWGAGAELVVIGSGNVAPMTNTPTLIPGMAANVELGAGQRLEVDGIFDLDPDYTAGIQTATVGLYDSGTQFGAITAVAQGYRQSSPMRWEITAAGWHKLEARAANGAAQGTARGASSRLVCRVVNAPAGSN